MHSVWNAMPLYLRTSCSETPVILLPHHSAFFHTTGVASSVRVNAAYISISIFSLFWFWSRVKCHVLAFILGNHPPNHRHRHHHGIKFAPVEMSCVSWKRSFLTSTKQIFLLVRWSGEENENKKVI